MKKLTIIGVLAMLVITSAFKMNSFWSVIDEKVSITFELPDEGTKGTLSGLKAAIDFDQKNISGAKISASVEIKTLNSGNKQKDDHLLSADFFNAEKYPLISFTSTSIKTTDSGFIATGDLTIKDSVKAVEIPFSFKEDAAGNAAFTGSVTILSGDYGVMKKSKTGKDKVIVTIAVPVKK